jgi:hypothetical protein
LSQRKKINISSTKQNAAQNSHSLFYTKLAFLILAAQISPSKQPSLDFSCNRTFQKWLAMVPNQGLSFLMLFQWGSTTTDGSVSKLKRLSEFLNLPQPRNGMFPNQWAPHS